jgi:uncharacterized membrane protein YjfL (UPF0719 family)
VAAVIIGPLLWAFWLFRMTQLEVIGERRIGTGTIAGTLGFSALLIFAILKTGASFDVVDAPQYLFMYVVLGLAWLWVVATIFPYLGLSPRDDVFERHNRAAVPAVRGALVGVTLCYAGGNIGDGPGWWVVVFAAALATSALLLSWMALTQLSSVADAVTIDRDPAAGIRLGAFLVSGGVILGRAVAGDWHSASATVADFSVFLPYVLLLVIAATLFERRAQPDTAKSSRGNRRLRRPSVAHLLDHRRRSFGDHGMAHMTNPLDLRSAARCRAVRADEAACHLRLLQVGSAGGRRVRDSHGIRS